MNIYFTFYLSKSSLASFWNSRWIGESLLRNQFPNLHAISHCKHLSVKNWVARFASSSNLGFGSNLNGQAQYEVGQLRSLIDSVQHSDASDMIIWRWGSSGLFSVSGAYSFLESDGVEDRSTRHLWSLKIPLRVKLFLWLAARNRLLTAKLLLRRGWFGPSVCTLCMANVERLDHILFDCPFATAVWEWLLIKFPHSCHSLLQASGDFLRRWRRARLSLSGHV